MLHRGTRTCVHSHVVLWLGSLTLTLTGWEVSPGRLRLPLHREVWNTPNPIFLNPDFKPLPSYTHVRHISINISDRLRELDTL